ncbi:MAG: hypothetical protein QFX37_03320 [Archaeoglobales archaeon]|nr:hypothetical protein [Archaeoglobales archaeon]
MSSNSPTDERHGSILCGKDHEIKALIREQFEAEVDLDLSIQGKGKIYANKECKFPLLSKSKGIYFGKLEKDGLRLSIEGSFIVGKTAKKGVLELEEKEAMDWLSGKDLKRDYKGYCILKWGEYFLGCGKGNGKMIKNYVPKDRRLRAVSEEFSD